MMNDPRQMPDSAWNCECLFLNGVPEQPSPTCRWLDIWHKTKGHIWLPHIASVIIVKQQDGDKKLFPPK
jgi:hypothetical protein